MDFGILLKAIGAMAFIVATAGIFVGWIMFCVHMIKNPILQGVIVPLPLLSFGVYMFYHTIAAVQQ
ncbi:hypothetical protein SWZG_00209 [Synechococcus phage S-SKS1]|uniref:Uncharacterized protein n=1 Tax=Synechococcus phage S-SKS1 TaxID=754042 RepID=M4QPY0_9CAUD|nr:hypothetical protein SWZG_00209 [Synechococcus phage S-SKS1]AGH31715.1 hypothetical protein SWZG_00209 [Synechococcus phage S-SKS1]|tara:strand:+ start:210 stop:407 length:198 start_codon:yes stop_codon:yes gene_type:complete